MNMETGGFGGDDRRRWLVPALIVAAVAIVLILILLIGKLVSSRGSSATATPARTPTRTVIIGAASATRAPLPSIGGVSSAPPNPSTAPTPTPVPAAKKFVVVARSGDGLNMRQNPAKNAEVLKVLQDGTRLEDLGQTQDADGIKWKHVKDTTDNTEGWVSSEFLDAVNP